MIISLKVLRFDQNVTGINTAKSLQSFFLIFEKKRGDQNQIRQLIIDEKKKRVMYKYLKKSKVSMNHFLKVSFSRM